MLKTGEKFDQQLCRVLWMTSRNATRLLFCPQGAFGHVIAGNEQGSWLHEFIQPEPQAARAPGSRGSALSLQGKHPRGLPEGGNISAELCRWGNSSRGETKGEEVGGRACSLSRLQKGQKELGLGRTANV